MTKIKSITRYTSTFNRQSITGNEQVEEKHLTSYTEMDTQGNVISDKTYNKHGELENHISRKYNDKNLLIQEDFYDGDSNEPYESRVNEYDERNYLVKSTISYMDDSVEEIYTCDDEGHLLKKEVIYADGEACVETACEWGPHGLLHITEYDDDEEPNVIRHYEYDEQGRISRAVMEEKSLMDMHTETYEYENNKITQTLYNLKGNPISVTISITNDKGELVGKTVETPSQFFKYIYSYDEQGNKKRESMLNRDDLLLNDQQTTYNDQGNEICTCIYSRNIVDNNDEMLPVEKLSTEYTYWE